MNIQLEALKSTALSLSKSYFLSDRVLAQLIEKDIEDKLKKLHKVELSSVYNMIEQVKGD